MTKFVSVDKMSKKARKAYYAKARNVWAVSPATRGFGKSNRSYKVAKAKMKGV